MYSGGKGGEWYFKQLPALHALFCSFSCVTYTEVICTHQQTVPAVAQGIISCISSGTFSVLSHIFLKSEWHVMTLDNMLWQHRETRTSNNANQ